MDDQYMIRAKKPPERKIKLGWKKADFERNANEMRARCCGVKGYIDEKYIQLITPDIQDEYFSVFWTDRIFHATYRGVFESIMEHGISGMGKYYIHMGIGVPKKEQIL